MKANTLAVLCTALMITLAGCSPSGNGGATDAETTQPAPVGIGQAVNAGYFQVTVNDVGETAFLEGNSAGPGNKFLVLDVTVKNTDAEGRLYTDGSLIWKRDSKEFVFDATETVLAEGYLLLETLNPLTSVTGKIVYKVPEDFSGEIYYQPGRATTRIRLARQDADPIATVAPAAVVEEPAGTITEPRIEDPAATESSNGEIQESPHNNLAGKSYEEVRGALTALGFSPFDTDPGMDYEHAGDPADCGNGGCSVSFRSPDGEAACVVIPGDSENEAEAEVSRIMQNDC